MPNNERFFSDPKVWIALLALLVSIASFIWNLYLQFEQNRKWDALNTGRVELIDVGFINFKEISREEAVSTNWGYSPLIYAYAENRLYSGRYRLPYELRLLNPSTRTMIPNSNSFFTIDEGQAEIARLNLQDGTYQIWKHLQIQFSFKNLGSTTAKKSNFIINQGPNEIFRSSQAVELSPSITSNIVANLWLPLDSQIGSILNFNLNIKYEDINREIIERNIPITYDPGQNYWTYGN